MSGVTSALWRTSVCGLVTALAVFSAGCAIENGDAGDVEEDTVAAQAAVTISLPTHNGGLKAPKNPVSGPNFTKGTQAKSPASKLDQVSEPEPEPWHPDARGGSDDPNDAVVSTTPDHSDDHK